MELAGPRAKLSWAAERLQVLEQDCAAYLESNPIRLSPEFNEAIESFEIRLRGPKDWPSLRWGVMVGDVVHNARSALDQAVWLLACRSNPVEQLWEPDVALRISFPVAKKPARFKKHSVLPYLADDAKAVLEELQPYSDGQTGGALADLDRLWNIDKHRVIHSTTAQLDVSSIKFRPGAIRVEDLVEAPETIWHPLQEPLADGTKVATVKFRDGKGPPFTTLRPSGNPPVTLGFGSGAFALPVDGIGELLVQTANALTKIEALPESLN